MMKKTWIVLLVVGMVGGLLAMPGTAAAKGNDKGSKPTVNGQACAVGDEVLLEAVFTQTEPDYIAVSYDIGSGAYDGDLTSDGNDLCVVVEATSGKFLDINVILANDDTQPVDRCGFYWPSGKLTEGSAFSAEFDLDGYYAATAQGFCGNQFPDENGTPLSLTLTPRMAKSSTSGTLTVTAGRSSG